MCAGFKVLEFGRNYHVVGTENTVLGDHYGSDLRSYYGVAIDKFPNFMTTLGPYSASFWSSVCDIVELQTQYNVQVIHHVKELNRSKGCNHAVMPKTKVLTDWVASLREGQQRLPGAADICKTGYKASRREKQLLAPRLFHSNIVN